MNTNEIDNYLSSFLDLNIAPARVIHKKGAISEMPEFLMSIGDNFAAISECSLYAKFKKFNKNTTLIDDKNVFYIQSNCCNYAEVDRLYSEIENSGQVDAIIAIGGGTIMDISKIVAYNMRKPLITVPTSAATCAAFTSLAVVYTKDSIFKQYDYLNKNPDICVMEPELLLGAGPRLLASGIADSIAKYIEGKWSYSGKIKDYYSELGMTAAFNLYNELLSIGAKAFLDVEAGLLTAEASDTFSYNIIASGLSSGIAGMKVYPNIAHSICNGVTAYYNRENYLDIYHGEAISVGMCAGMLLMQSDYEKTRNFASILKSLKLPISLSGLSSLSSASKNASREEIAGVIVEKAMQANESIHDISFINSELLYKALIETDNLTF